MSGCSIAIETASSPDARDVALIPAAEFARLVETAHLRQSLQNARRLLSALRWAERGKIKPTIIAEMRLRCSVETASKRIAVSDPDFLL
jgi:hypothetical protein